MAPRAKKQTAPPVAISDDMKSMDFGVYETQHKNYQLWVDVLFDKLRLPFPIPAILLGAIPFFIGLLISIAISFQKQYLETLAIYLGAFGIAWVLAILNHSSREFHSAYSELRPCFLVSDKEYSQLIDKWFKLFSNHKRNYIGVLVLALIAIVAVFVVYYHPALVALINSNSLTQVFPAYWYSVDNKFTKALIIAVWGVFVAFPLGTAARLLIFNFFFLLQLRKLPVIPIPSMIKVRLQKINGLYIFIASTWFVGVGLFGILFFDKLDFMSILGLGALSLFGTVTFLTPQFIYRQFLVQSHKVATQWVLYSFYSSLNIKLQEKATTNIPTEIGSDLAKMNDLKGFIDVSKQSDAWVYDPTDFLLLLLGQIVSFGSVYIQNLITSILP